MMTLPAFLFDLNGTMINDMPYHIKAWHSIFNNLGAGISMERMKSESYGKNSEVIERIMPGRFTAEEKKAMSRAKEMQYQNEFRPHLKLLPGLDTFLHNAHQSGIKMAIGSAAIMYNIDFVLCGLSIRNYFSAIVSADDVEVSKPNPETFLKCATLLGAEPDQCVVFEDAPKGVEAAQNAGMKCVVLTTMHTADEFSDYNNIINFCADYRNLNPFDLIHALAK